MYKLKSFPYFVIRNNFLVGKYSQFLLIDDDEKKTSPIVFDCLFFLMFKDDSYCLGCKRTHVQCTYNMYVFPPVSKFKLPWSIKFFGKTSGRKPVKEEHLIVLLFCLYSLFLNNPFYCYRRIINGVKFHFYVL